MSLLSRAVSEGSSHLGRARCFQFVYSASETWVMTAKPVFGLIGAPSSAGAFAPGQEDAPGALRDLGLVGQMRDAGLDVVDLGDTPRFRWRPDREQPLAMNAGAVREAALAVA